MKNVYENMTHHLDPDDRIAGYWTEYFLGIPIDIERGVFNQVLAAELTKSSMIVSACRSLGKGLSFLVRKAGPSVNFIQKPEDGVGEMGARPPQPGASDHGRERDQPFQIEDDDRRYLLRELLPYWKGKDRSRRCWRRSWRNRGLFTEDMHEFATAITATRPARC